MIPFPSYVHKKDLNIFFHKFIYLSLFHHAKRFCLIRSVEKKIYDLISKIMIHLELNEHRLIHRFLATPYR